MENKLQSARHGSPSQGIINRAGSFCSKGESMAKVKLVKDERLGSMPQTWSLWRVGTGPGRGEGCGFLSVAEAKEFAAKYGHEIVNKKRQQG